MNKDTLYLSLGIFILFQKLIEIFFRNPPGIINQPCNVESVDRHLFL